MNRLVRYLPALLTTGLIFVFSVMKNPLPEVDMSHGLDKLAHCAMYWLLAFLLSAGFRRDGLGRHLFSFWLAWIASSVYGGMIEIVQQCFFPPRTGEWADFLADIVGALAGVATVGFLWNTRRIQ